MASSGYCSDDDEFRAAWESHFSAEKQCHKLEQKQLNIEHRIELATEELDKQRKDIREISERIAQQKARRLEVNRALGEVCQQLMV
jgi:septal ring factor EnvC (AmiA/AmiB activator)